MAAHVDLHTYEAVQKDNLLSAQFRINNDYDSELLTYTSEEFRFKNSVIFQTKAMVLNFRGEYASNECINLIFISFKNANPNDSTIYTAKLSSNKLSILNKVIMTDASDDGTWRLILDSNKENDLGFDFTVLLDETPRLSFSSLYGDTELTDFELSGEDGSVNVHKAVLAACSPMLRRMFCGQWKESTNGRVQISGISLITLQHLKDFLYLQTLPDEGLEQLLLLSSCYMIQDLEQRCIDKLIRNVTAENACELNEFAAKNNITKLTLAIFDLVQRGVIKVEDMRLFNECT